LRYCSRQNAPVRAVAAILSGARLRKRPGTCEANLGCLASLVRVVLFPVRVARTSSDVFGWSCLPGAASDCPVPATTSDQAGCIELGGQLSRRDITSGVVEWRHATTSSWQSYRPPRRPRSPVIWGDVGLREGQGSPWVTAFPSPQISSGTPRGIRSPWKAPPAQLSTQCIV